MTPVLEYTCNSFAARTVERSLYNHWWLSRSAWGSAIEHTCNNNNPGQVLDSLWLGFDYRAAYSWSCLLLTTPFVLGVITFEPIEIQTCSAHQNDQLNLNFVKNIYVDNKKLARNCQKMIILAAVDGYQ